ncbi:MAG TPA: efflux RND transporter periplasmic adaptor subunit, partial [Polyangiaceae bacterium]|nr:efflux RND transporter periplasmic adaptor subunit [Polyangiaceae bacterium]
DLTLRASFRGELDADVAELAAQATGYLRDLKVAIGDPVKKDDVLGQVEPTQAERDIAEAQAEVLGAMAAKKKNAAQLTAAEKELERGKGQLESGLISEKDHTQLKANYEVLQAESDATAAQVVQAQARVSSLRQRLSDTRLIAPFDGAVAERYVDPGTVVQPGKAILRLVKTGPLRVRFRVPERDVSRIRTGMRFSVVTQATGSERFSGEVVRIGAEISRLDRNVAVEGLLQKETPKLRPGMYADVTIKLGQLESAVVVPSVAIVEQHKPDGSKQSGLFVVRDDKAVWTAVNVRGATGDKSAVDVIQPGDAIVILGQNSLRDGAVVRVNEP